MPAEEFAPAPFEIDEVLSGRWLTAALRRTFPGIVVGRSDVVVSLESTARKVRFTISYEETSGHQELPTALCVKGYFNPEYRQYGSTGIHEARFYDVLASTVPIVVPSPRYAGIDREIGHGLVLMDDVVAKGSVFYDQLDYYDLATARLSLTELARLHARFWEQPICQQEWLAPKIRMFPTFIPTETMNELLRGSRGEGFPAGMRDAQRLKAGMEALADRYSAQPRTLIHADAHLGNLYRTLDGRIGFVDWQNYEAGSWAMDVAYHLSTALKPSVRAEHEDELLTFYLETLAARGGPTMSLADAWDDYRVGAAYGYFLWAMTRRVEPRITEELTQRLGKAVFDHNSLEVLGV
jgi:thiamine kinase-like enzyme